MVTAQCQFNKLLFVAVTVRGRKFYYHDDHDDDEDDGDG